MTSYSLQEQFSFMPSLPSILFKRAYRTYSIVLLAFGLALVSSVIYLIDRYTKEELAIYYTVRQQHKSQEIAKLSLLIVYDSLEPFTQKQSKLKAVADDFLYSHKALMIGEASGIASISRSCDSAFFYISRLNRLVDIMHQNAYVVTKENVSNADKVESIKRISAAESLFADVMRGFVHHITQTSIARLSLIQVVLLAGFVLLMVLLYIVMRLVLRPAMLASDQAFMELSNRKEDLKKANRVLEDIQSELKVAESKLIRNMEELLITGEAIEKERRLVKKQAQVFHDVLNDCSFAIISTDREGQVRFANRAATRLWRSKGHELEEKYFLDLILSNQFQSFESLVIALEFQSNQNFQSVKIVCKDETVLNTKISIGSYDEVHTNTERHTFFIEDITEFQSFAQQVRQLSIIAEEISESVFITNAAYDIVWCNKATVTLTGYFEQELYGKKLNLMLQGPLTAITHQANIESGLLKKVPFTQEVLYYRRDNSTYWIELGVTPFFDKDNHLEGFICIQRDINIRKEHELSIKAYNKELAKNNERLEHEVEQRVKDIRYQTQQVQDSIRYAQRIQYAILPSPKAIASKIPDSFIFFQPRDIVSGDFYWFADKYDKSILVAADCTGHGVPGAFISLICESLLNKVVHDYEIYRPAHILLKMNESLKEVLRKSDDYTMRDGMDAAICCIEHKRKKVVFSGAKSGMLCIRDNSAQYIKGAKNSIDGAKGHSFEDTVIDIGDGVMAYMGSDGYQDQFGGKDDKKFMRKRLIEYLHSISHLPLPEQQIALSTTFNDWKGHKKQTDDVLIIGFRL
ncbi:MAG: PAS domain-containing protein [Cytophagales bacterium]|nr:MAG: PAS domain-containing protein [Cytophagales bacterium]TAF61658.1 MAG: PAS domain-containing protein [Cytophagales bacterium]